MLKLLAALSLGIIVFGGCSDHAPEVATPTTFATAAPTLTSSPTPPLSATPTATTEPACEPLSPDSGFPVMLGRIREATCVIWHGNGAAKVVIEEGAFLTDNPPIAVHSFDRSVSPFEIPSGVLPALVPGRACFAEDRGFTVRVLSTDGVQLGAESFYACARRAVLADGCSAGLPPSLGTDDSVEVSRTDGGAACIMWSDRESNELGFRIKLSYPHSGEVFTYTAPPNTVEFIPPAADTQGIGQPGFGLNRKDWELQVFAVTPLGDVVVGGQFVQVG